tara:strand:+ start:6516 stop:6770 length:255 start_codon:yes stop_codon:yes gene_type:complete
MEMKWLAVVLFATMQGDMYIFNSPSFDTREECMIAIEERRVDMLTKLYMEYGRPMPIRFINCVDTDTLNELFEKYDMQQTTPEV